MNKGRDLIRLELERLHPAKAEAEDNRSAQYKLARMALERGQQLTSAQKIALGLEHELHPSPETIKELKEEAKRKE